MMEKTVFENYPENLFGHLLFLVDHIKKEVPDFSPWNLRNFSLEEMPTKIRHHYIFHFPNKYGASVIKGPGTYGYEKDLWELAVLKERCGEWELCYDTEITGDVEGYLSVEDVEDLLDRIAAL